MTSTTATRETDQTPVNYQADPEQSLSEAVLEAVATATDVDQIALADEFGPLYHAVDPSALDSLFHDRCETDRAVGSVTFEYAGFLVSVDRTRQVTLTS
ncbi:HalOD1 output domain-containing protein [Natronococcus amylolyticus]|uniref:HalOD1 output domain-containing protein n=1 Tax=Natronococcus amylolyticus TaxID=44470 RepID=UPI0006781436|nr:HalOD1 output domain-containing protein [Natronococcus amylolyticus]